LNNATRRKVVRDMAGEYRETIVALQETKLDHVDSQVVMDTLGVRFVDNFIALPTVGTRGGILLAVDEAYYKIVNTELGVYSVTAKLVSLAGPVEWCITVVYGPQQDNEKIQFLGELKWIQHTIIDKWLLLWFQHDFTS
jgi:exonuclease III